MRADQPDTRQALLDAGLALLGELTPADLVAALRTRGIAARAGVSPPTFFHHFKSVEDYAAALVEHVYAPGRTRLRGVVRESLQAAQRVDLPAQQSIAYHARDLQRMAADPTHRIRTGLWALGGPQVDAAYGSFLAEAERQLVPQARAFQEAWGREVRPPLDVQSYLALQIAILTGSAVRHVTDPTVMSTERYARAAAALSMVMLRPAGDRRTMDDRLSEMNWQRTPSRTSRTAAVRRDSTRTRLVEAAADLFGEYGYEATSITQLARAANVHVATLYDHFDGKAHLALALFDRHADAALAGRAEALTEHLEDVAALVDANQDLARIYLAALACGDQPADVADVVRTTTVEHLRSWLDASADVDRAADHVLVATIGAMLRHPGDGVAAAAAAGLRFVGDRAAAE